MILQILHWKSAAHAMSYDAHICACLPVCPMASCRELLMLESGNLVCMMWTTRELLQQISLQFIGFEERYNHSKCQKNLHAF